MVNGVIVKLTSSFSGFGIFDDIGFLHSSELLEVRVEFAVWQILGETSNEQFSLALVLLFALGLVSVEGRLTVDLLELVARIGDRWVPWIR